MKMTALATTIAVAIFLVPIQALGKTDRLCAPLRHFIADIGPGEHREIIFRTSWGGGFKDDPETKDSFSTKRCEHGGYDKAKAVCAVLMEDASVEFGNVNTMRAVVCISPEIHFPRYNAFEHGAFTLQYGNDDRGANISVSFEEDPQVGGMALRVLANGY